MLAHPALAGELPQPGTLAHVARFLPRVHRAARQRASLVRHDELLVVFEGCAEAGAGGAGAVGAVEGEELRGRVGELDVGMERAAEALGEAQAGFAGGRGRAHDHGFAQALDEGHSEGVGQAVAYSWIDGQPVDHHQGFARNCQVGARAGGITRARRGQIDHRAVRHDAKEPGGAQRLHHLGVRGAPAGLERKRHHDSLPGGQREHTVHRPGHRVPADPAAAARAVRVPDARPQQPQVVVDLGRGAHRRAAGAGRVLLLDRHGGRDPFHRLDPRLAHAV